MARRTLDWRGHESHGAQRGRRCAQKYGVGALKAGARERWFGAGDRTELPVSSRAEFGPIRPINRPEEHHEPVNQPPCTEVETTVDNICLG
ncbi:hypothetical protein EVAR_97335_1 [Eumeta japonica]|uniref:Uncharacterized protein n=1 Tax=Eumeta variegata TaxID=151549 RepID=A0A4C1X5D4_EUMVA|nr:hypothetical protein EVAR_97335_1 [Eumeta japonica]